jgi:hypothetical protein
VVGVFKGLGVGIPSLVGVSTGSVVSPPTVQEKTDRINIIKAVVDNNRGIKLKFAFDFSIIDLDCLFF